MAITASYGFDGTINEAQWSTLHSVVNRGHVDGMVASVGAGTREVDLTSGTAWAVGTYHVASATTVALSANSSGNTRIDTIVVNIDFSTDTATVTAVQGTPAASPVAPTLTQTAGTQWQIPLCHVTVDDGATSFSSADIENARPALLAQETGTVTTGPSSAASFTTDVSFTGTFASPPQVFINLPSGSGTTAKWHGRAISITTTGFTLFGFGDSSTTFSSAWQWFAVGPIT